MAPHVFIGKNVKIGKNVMIHSGCNILSGSSIGDDTILYPNVTIYSNVFIGSNCRIHASSVIGADGFGYYYKQGIHHKIWHYGGVVIGNNVEVGQNVYAAQYSPADGSRIAFGDATGRIFIYGIGAGLFFDNVNLMFDQNVTLRGITSFGDYCLINSMGKP